MRVNAKNRINRSRRNGLILGIVFSFLLAALSPLSAREKDWRPEVDRLFQTENNQAQVVIFLESRYSGIPANDRRLATLILAYCYNHLKKPAEESFWMTRHAAFSKEDPLDLSFVTSLERLRIIEYRDQKLRNQIRLVSTVLSEASRRFPYFDRPPTLDFRLELSGPVDYRLQDHLGNILQQGNAKNNEIRVQLPISHEFFTRPEHNLKLLLGKAPARDEYEIVLGLEFETPVEIVFNPLSGSISRRLEPEAPPEEIPPAPVSGRKLDKKLFLDRVVKNVLIGSTLLLVNATLIKNTYNRDGTSANLRSLAWGGRTVVKSFGWGFNLLALANLPKVFRKTELIDTPPPRPAAPELRELSPEEAYAWREKIFVRPSLRVKD